MNQDFKSNDIEIGMITTENRRFMNLSCDQIESHLNAIADRDWPTTDTLYV